MRVLIWYLVAVNVLTYLVYWWDKSRARRGKRRISEKELLLWALAGGSLGAVLAMRTHRHKTRKTSFRLWMFGVLLLQAAAIGFVVWQSRQA